MFSPIKNLLDNPVPLTLYQPFSVTSLVNENLKTYSLTCGYDFQSVNEPKDIYDLIDRYLSANGMRYLFSKAMFKKR